MQLRIRLYHQAQALEGHIAMVYATVSATTGIIVTFATPEPSGDVGSYIAPNGSECVSAKGAVVFIFDGGT